MTRFRDRLAVRIVLPFAVALVAVFTPTALYLGRTVRIEGLRELGERGALLADTLAYNAELPLLARDTGALRTLLEGAGRDPDLVEAVVLDASGAVLARHSPRGAASRDGRAARHLALESPITTSGAFSGGGEEPVFALDEPPRTPPRSLGRIRILVSTERTATRTRRLQGQIAAAGAGLLIACAGIGIGLVRVLGRPLRDLVRATRRVASGDLSVRVSPSTTDEIGELGIAFNRMAVDLEVARSALEAEQTDLERRVAERTADLQRAHETLVQSEKLNAVGQLVAGVAHELNNPLTVVLGYSGLILQQTTDPALRRRLELVSGEAERCRKIVQNLLTFARKQKHERSRVDLNDAISRTLALRAYHLRTENITVETHLDPGLPPAWADLNQIQQVILNLLVNAEQAIQDAGKGTRIRIATRPSGDGVEIVLEDDGPGILPAHRARIFEPFFTTKPVGRGTGLGLSICYGIIQEHGGAVEVESEPGAFTRFRIRLPVDPRAEERTDPRPATPEDPPAVPTRRRVLVIDDDPAILQYVGEAFEGLPVTVETAMGGRDGIARLATGRPFDLVLADLRMPDLDGRGLFLFLRERRPDLESRLVFATGDVANPESLEFLKRCGRPVLEKPFRAEALRDLLDSRTR